VIFFRKYYYLQTTAQIASETGMTERAIEGRLYRIKKRLRKLLGGDGNA
jgi:RNA polymerase sigma-70 factor (ECF subfamily)